MNLANKLWIAIIMALLCCQLCLAQQAQLAAKIPFEVKNGAIILTVKLNDNERPLKLLFDTGADGMAITKDLADSLGLKESRKQNASVVGGNVQISVSEGNDVHMGAFTFKNQSIAFFKEMHKGTDGIIGNTLARHYITKVDFDKREMSLYTFGEYVYGQAGMLVPVTIPKGVFIVPGTLSITAGQQHAGNFVFDTGASYNLICFRPFVRKNKLLVSGFKADGHGSTTSMGISTPTFIGKASSFFFSNMSPLKNFSVTLMAGGGQSESWEPGFDGSIGINLISRYNFTINMQRKEIYFTPNGNYNKENL